MRSARLVPQSGPPAQEEPRPPSREPSSCTMRQRNASSLLCVDPGYLLAQPIKQGLDSNPGWIKAGSPEKCETSYFVIAYLWRTEWFDNLALLPDPVFFLVWLEGDCFASSTVWMNSL